MSNEALTVVAPLSAPLKGEIRVPGDKSISHRVVLFSAMAQGVSHVSGILDSDDVQSSISAVKQLGAKVNLEKQEDGSLAGTIEGWGEKGPLEPEKSIDCGNSGTTARLLMGILAPWEISVTITGDASLQSRPMRRITAPLMKMGVKFLPDAAEHLPITVTGTRQLKAINYDAPMSSAQLKTAVLIAGVYARGTTTLTEPSPSRNHTELMLPEYGITTTASERQASVTGPDVLSACEILVSGDPSSAAFLICAAVLQVNSSIKISDVSLNTARIGFVRTLERMGADITVFHSGSEGKEPYGVIEARYAGKLRGCEIPAEKIPSIIDEVPVLSLVAAFSKGLTVFRGIEELRVKETDRLEAIVEGLELIGIDAWIDGSDLFIEGQPDLQIPEGITFDSKNDHRLAMTWSLVGLVGNVSVKVANYDSIKISYPEFLKDIERLTR